MGMSLVAYTRGTPTFSERVLDLSDKIDYRQALTDDERDAVYHLRYDAYMREGTIAPSFGRRLSDKYDDLDNAWIFGVFVSGRLSASIRLNISSPAAPDIPAMGVFSDILEPIIASGKTVIDPTRFVVDHAAAKEFPELPYLTVRIGWMAGEYFGADMILATVRAEHQAFYKRIFGHELLAEPRDYPSLKKPISMMALDYFAMKPRVHHRYPFFRSTAFERRMLFGGANTGAVWAHRPEELPQGDAAALVG
jgi:hypothetical protein